MKKEFFKKFSQAVCIAAVGLLVGSSLDYALNGYGVLANPNVFAEGTSATATANTSRSTETTMEKVKCSCMVYESASINDPVQQVVKESWQYRSKTVYVPSQPGDVPLYGPWGPCHVTYLNYGVSTGLDC